MLDRYEEGTISKGVLKNLEMMAATSPQYAQNSNVPIVVRLTDYGRTLYISKIYQDRPVLKDSSADIMNYDKNTFEFNCSEMQAYLYFRKFGDNAEIIEPESLRKKMAEYYKGGYSLYYPNGDSQNKDE